MFKNDNKVFLSHFCIFDNEHFPTRVFKPNRNHSNHHRNCNYLDEIKNDIHIFPNQMSHISTQFNENQSLPFILKIQMYRSWFLLLSNHI